MPISVSCGGCGKKMRAPDSLAGKKVKCPGCGRSIAVEAAAPPPPPEDDNPFGSMYAPGTAAAAAVQKDTVDSSFPGTRESWKRVCTGLNLLRFGVVFRSFVTMGIILWLTVVFIQDKPFFTVSEKAGVLAYWGRMVGDASRPAMNLLAMPLTILGFLLCMAAPMARGAKLLALLALFLALFMALLYCPGNIGVFVFDVAHVDSGRFENALKYVNLAALAGAVAEFMQFFIAIFFLRACGATFSQRVGTVFLLLAGFLWISLACGVGGYVVFATGNLGNITDSEAVLGEFRQPGPIALIASIALNVLGLFWLLNYFISISRTRAAIVRNLFRLPSSES